MRNDVPAADSTDGHSLENFFFQLINEPDTLENFIQKIQGKTLREIEKKWVWEKDEKKPAIINEAGANYIRIYLEMLLSRGAKTTVLSDDDIKRICFETARDMRENLILNAVDYKVKDVFMSPLKNMVVNFAFISLTKSSHDGKMLNVIKETTQRRILQTQTVTTESEKKGIPLLGNLFKKRS